MEECPICTEPLTGTIATMGCCKKVLHVECLINCMRQKLLCPMCRAEHESLRVVQNPETQVLIVESTPLNSKFFRNFFLATVAASIVCVSVTMT